MAALDKLTGLKKAAILLICLGEETATKLLRELTDEEIFKVTRCMADIEHIPEEVKTRVLQDFELVAEGQAGLVVKGQEFAKKLIAGSWQQEQGNQPDATVRHRHRSPPPGNHLQNAALHGRRPA
jgi:flagellar motor switch protein FliG